MTYLLKDPEAVLDYAVDWGADYLDGDVIVESGWTVDPAEDGGVSILADAVDVNIASVQVQAGIAGRLYRVTNRVALGSGRTDERSILLRVEQR